MGQAQGPQAVHKCRISSFQQFHNVCNMTTSPTCTGQTDQAASNVDVSISHAAIPAANCMREVSSTAKVSILCMLVHKRYALPMHKVCALPVLSRDVAYFMV